MTGSSTRFLLIYGTQTGQAKAICEEIFERSSRLGLMAELHCFGRIEKDFSIENEDLAVIVTSTTGDGEPPDTVQKFWRRIKRRTVQKDYLSKLNYALLGLGDSNYSNFCNCAKMMDARLQEVGARHFVPSGYADDATGLELVVEPWIEMLLVALCKHFQLPVPTVHELAYMPKPLNKDSCTETQEKIVSEAASRLHIDSAAVEANHIQTPHIPDGIDNQREWINKIPATDEALLSVPVPPALYLKVEAIKVPSEKPTESCLHNEHKLPFAGSPVYSVPILGIRQLTSPKAVKTTLEVILDVRGNVDYESGDTFSIIAENHSGEVEWLLKRLKIDDPSQIVTISVMPETTKKKAAVPEYLNNSSSLLDIITNCVDIRATPKKAFLALLATFCADINEGRQLLTLSSKEGAELYHELIMEGRRGLLHVLDAFMSCTPSIEVLLENLPRLLPRAYSVASGSRSEQLKFAFNVLDLPDLTYVKKRKGIITGKFADLSIAQSTVYPQVRMFYRNQYNFRLPADARIPLILVGPGTGLAPFLGFLEDRLKLIESGGELGDCVLFFGNRHQDHDYLYRDSLESHVDKGSLSHLFVTFSRDVEASSAKPRYVTDLIKQQSALLSNLITEKSACIYVCGDAKNMAKDVLGAFVEVLVNDKGYNEEEALNMIKSMRKEKRYREDVWT